MKTIENPIIEELNKSSNTQNLNVDDIKEIVTQFLKTGKIISVKDSVDGKKFVVELDDNNFDTEFDKLTDYFKETYGVDVSYDIETDSIEIYKKKFPKLNDINTNINHDQDNKINYSNMSINNLKKELIGKLLLKRDKLYGEDFGDGYEIRGVIKRGSNIFIEYMDGTTPKELNIKELDQNDSQYYENQISKDKDSKG